GPSTAYPARPGTDRVSRRSHGAESTTATTRAGTHRCSSRSSGMAVLREDAACTALVPVRVAAARPVTWERASRTAVVSGGAFTRRPPARGRGAARPPHRGRDRPAGAGRAG